LSGGGHGLVASHDVFHSPFETGAAETEEVDTPKNYFKYPDGAGLESKTRVWRVHADPLKRSDWGLVSNWYGFLDSPDCEFIASGINSKGPHSVAIGRQGNFLLWGFCAPPAEMTESARKAFLNATTYIKKFDGAPILVRDPVQAREWALVHAKYLADPKAKEWAVKAFAPKLLEAAKNDPEELQNLLMAGFDRIRGDKGPDGGFVFSLDEDVEALGLANNDPQLIDACLNLIGHREQVERSHRLMVRYLGVDLGPDYSHWVSWWARHKDRMFFSDTAGYRFVLKPDPKAAESRKSG
jgi:hypothetical protein